MLTEQPEKLLPKFGTNQDDQPQLVDSAERLGRAQQNTISQGNISGKNYFEDEQKHDEIKVVDDSEAHHERARNCLDNDILKDEYYKILNLKMVENSMQNKP